MIRIYKYINIIAFIALTAIYSCSNPKIPTDFDASAKEVVIYPDYKDVVIPIKAIFTAEIETGKSEYGYSVDSVYGLIGSAWNGTVKETKYMNEDEIKSITKEVA